MNHLKSYENEAEVAGEPEGVGDGMQPESEDHTAPAMKQFFLELHLPLDSQAVGYHVLPEALG